MNPFKKTLIFICLIIMITPSISLGSSPQIFMRITTLGVVRALNTDRERPSFQKCQKGVQTVQHLIATELQSQGFFHGNRYKKQQTAPHLQITPDQARQAIEQTILTAYKDTSADSPLKHLDEIKALSHHLDPIEDKETIEAINFVSTHQNRTSILFDTTFWISAWNETGILKKFPFPKELRETPSSEIVPRIYELSKKI